MRKSYLFDELDKILAIVGVIFSLILTIWLILIKTLPIYTIVGTLCFITCIGYLIIRRFFNPLLITSLEELRCSARLYIMLNILFFLLFSYSIISIYLRPDPYIRPLGYFISTAIMSVILANEILFLPNQKPHICFALFKIIIIGLSLSYSQTMIFPSIVGIDPWAHQWFTLKILDNGHIPDGLAYSKLPMMHLMIGMTSLVTDLSYKMATMFSISSMQVICDALFIFLLGKFLIGNKVGLLAALLLEVSDYHIRFSYWTIPNTMAATLILPILYVLFKLRKDKRFIGNAITLFLMGTLILTHTVTTICLAIYLFVLCLSFDVYSKIFQREPYRSVTWTILIIFTTTFLSYWTFVSGHITFLWRLIEVGFRSKNVLLLFQFLSSIPLWEQTFMSLGMFLFFSLSFIGCFYMMSKKVRNSSRFIFTIGGVMILCITFLALIFGKYIIVGRWYYFSQIYLAIPLSLSLLLLVGIFRNNMVKCFFMSILVFTLSIILISNPIANMDNRLFYPSRVVRYAFTDSELCAMDTISEIWSGPIGCDYYSFRPYKLNFNREFVVLDDSIDTGDFTHLQGTFLLIREEIMKHPFQIRGGIKSLKYDIQVALDNQNFSLIYNCGSASGYLQP